MDFQAQSSQPFHSPATVALSRPQNFLSLLPAWGETGLLELFVQGVVCAELQPRHAVDGRGHAVDDEGLTQQSMLLMVVVMTAYASWWSWVGEGAQWTVVWVGLAFLHGGMVDKEAVCRYLSVFWWVAGWERPERLVRSCPPWAPLWR